MGIRQLPNGRWRLQIRRKGFPTVDRVFATRAEAESVLPDHEPKPHKSDTTLSKIWEQYAASYEFSSKASNTQATERCRIRPVLSALGEYSLENLEKNPSEIYDYIDRRARAKSERTGRKLSATSIRLEIAALSALAAYAKKRRLIPGNFVRHIDRPTTKKRRRRVPPKEQGGLQLAVHEHGAYTAEPARFALLLRLLGCRPGELAGLLKADVNLPQQDVLFRDTKNGTDRRVHTTEQARALLAVQLADAPQDAPFFFNVRPR